MVFKETTTFRPGVHLSVLALSSRFDGPRKELEALLTQELSVLALSSRFDGRGTRAEIDHA